MTDAILLGFDPGRDKCGIAVLAGDRLLAHQIIPAGEVGETVGVWRDRYPNVRIVMGNQTTSAYWERHLRDLLPDIDIVLVDERNSSLEARDRFWKMYPPRGFSRLVPQGMRLPPRPIDDIVAILLVERYRQTQTATSNPGSDDSGSNNSGTGNPSGDGSDRDDSGRTASDCDDPSATGPPAP